MSTVCSTKSQIYVVDTSALLEDPNVFQKLEGQIVIPMSVIKQLDLQKNSNDQVIAKSSRRVTSFLDKISATGDITTGFTVSSRATVRMTDKFDNVNLLDSFADNRIVGVAKRLKRETRERVVVLTTDKNMRLASRALGLEAGFAEYIQTVKIIRYTNDRATVAMDWYEEFSNAFLGMVKFLGAALVCYAIFFIVTVMKKGDLK